MERLRNSFKEKQWDRLFWCLLVAAFCWTDVADYHHFVYNKKLLLFSIAAIYSIIKLGGFKRKNLLLTVVSSSIGACLCGFLILTNYFSDYVYYNYTVGFLFVVVLAQYALLVKRIIKKGSIPKLSMPCVLLLLLFISIQLSPMSDVKIYQILFFLLLPYGCLELSNEENRQVWMGMIDGLCLGFVICQTYTFLYRPYVLTENGSRFKAFREYCTSAGVSYMQFYVGCFLKFGMAVRNRAGFFKKMVLFVTSAFILSLMYLTGGRSPVLGSMAVTAVVVYWMYQTKAKNKWLVKWFVTCACIGVLSLALFPVAYAGTRYLPTIINNPDLQDSEGNRSNSFATQILKQQFLRNGEWSGWSVRAGDPADSYKYVTFEESLLETLGRIVPGLDRVLLPTYGDEVFAHKVKRLTRLHRAGKVNDVEACGKIMTYCYYYEKDIPPYYEEIVERYGYDVGIIASNSDAAENHTEDSLCRRESLQKAALLQKVYAAAQEDAASENKKNGRGESVETGWFEAQGTYSAMELRIALYTYTFRHFRLLGHEEGEFEMYYVKGEDEYLGGPHNIFLHMGYQYGVPAMLLMLALFGMLAAKGWRAAKAPEEGYYLVSVLLVVAMTVFGSFEMGFSYGNSFTTIIFLSAVFWKESAQGDADSTVGTVSRT